MRPFRIGTRSSRLALYQANLVRSAVTEHHPELVIEIVEISSRGDQDRERPFAAFGETGLFTSALEAALNEERIDAAIHSLKDLPSQLPDALHLAGFLRREDPRDVLIAPGATAIDSLPASPLIATGSPRRRAQLLQHRPQARFIDIRGNIETRLERFAESGADAMVLAAAGLHRLALHDSISTYLSVDEMIPAPGQGIVAAECRVNDDNASRLLREVSDTDAAAAATAERSFMALLDGGCQAPVGAHATVDGTALTLRAVVLSTDGSRVVEGSVSGRREKAADLGSRLAERLISEGASEILASSREGASR